MIMDRESLTLLLKRNGLFVTNPRLQVLDILSEENGPISIENIVSR